MLKLSPTPNHSCANATSSPKALSKATVVLASTSGSLVSGSTSILYVSAEDPDPEGRVRSVT
jgi:hypothetical protein